MRIIRFTNHSVGRRCRDASVDCQWTREGGAAAPPCQFYGSVCHLDDPPGKMTFCWEIGIFEPVPCTGGAELHLPPLCFHAGKAFHRAGKSFHETGMFWLDGRMLRSGAGKPCFEPGMRSLEQRRVSFQKSLGGCNGRNSKICHSLSRVWSTLKSAFQICVF